MKNSTKIIGALAVILSITFACKKDKQDVQSEEKEQKFSAPIQMAAKGESENAIIIGTNTELEAAFSGKQDVVYLKKAASKNNLFVPVTGTVGPVDPVNPSELCWDEIHNYYSAHIDSWLSIANQTCKPLPVCITCPNAGGGLYVLYIIKPTSPRCNISEATAVLYNFSKFNFTANQYESESVSSYINTGK
ncbi:hypothetical protein FW774_06890 [Pedobacter sp. BS3]|uniref:hypothetical protein n=1 Tax=Pedobacter sp. BS3 TaxID=2567937 RepID=UPI0011F076E5|nr:hypothetical protein [Pedobacter sp. BS3]TZF84703.1 hypothetical protein FW774_06890 [Pedobacter sp. BS3]